MHFPGDIDFVPVKIRRNVFARAMRRAVLFPVVPVGANGKDGVALMMQQLRVKWRKSLAQLRESGWPKLCPDPNLNDAERKDHMYRQLRNCPPFGVDTKHKVHTCRQSLLCPFCWARMTTVPLVKRLLGTFHPCGQESRDNLQLLELHSFKRHDRPKSDQGFGDLLMQLKKERQLDTETAKELQFGCVYGSYTLHSVELHPKSVAVWRRSAVIVPRQGEIQVSETGPSYRRYLHDSISTGVLSRAAGEITRYPKRTLLGDPRDTLYLQQQVKRFGFRFSTCIGCFRTSKIGF